MAYCAKADLEATIGVDDVASLSTVGGVQSDATIEAAIAEADARIDSYAHKRDAVPYSPVPSTIKNLSIQMAIRNLRRDRRMSTTQDALDEERDEKWLTALAKGLVSAGPGTPADANLAVDKYGKREDVVPNLKTATRNGLKGFW